MPGCLAIPFFLLICSWRAPTPLAAQEANFRTLSTELVVLPVVVTDKRGSVLSDLDRHQFTIYDNGRSTPIELFTNEDVPVSVGLVIDDSSSMRVKLGQVIATTLRFAQLSNPDDELFTLSFNDDVRDAVPDRRFLLAGDFRVLESALQSLAPQGQTAMYDALIAALDRLDQASRPRKILILMSDGGDNASAATLDRVLARARTSNAAIYTIGLYDRDDPDRNPKVLQAIARATGGERFLPESAAPLLRVCEQIAREIRSGYTIGFVPPDRDGAYHRVQVVVRSDRSVRVRTRPGYFAGNHKNHNEH